jgi:hypothetical protein
MAKKKSKGMGKERSRSLPVLQQVSRVRSLAERQLGMEPGGLVTVEIDDPIPFSCARSGNCCTGRHVLSNRVMHKEFALQYHMMLKVGMVKSLADLIPDRVARATSAPSGAGPKTGTLDSDTSGVRLGDGGVYFIGLFFGTIPDGERGARYGWDATRCIYLLPSDVSKGDHACLWHGTRAQPAQCALAPLALATDAITASEPRYFYPRSRFRWCAGMREAKAGLRPSTTAREILDRNDGEDRIAELIEYAAAAKETMGWVARDGERLSPLARLYVRELPELELWLNGY